MLILTLDILNYGCYCRVLSQVTQRSPRGTYTSRPQARTRVSFAHLRSSQRGYWPPMVLHKGPRSLIVLAGVLATFLCFSLRVGRRQRVVASQLSIRTQQRSPVFTASFNTIPRAGVRNYAPGEGARRVGWQVRVFERCGLWGVKLKSSLSSLYSGTSLGVGPHVKSRSRATEGKYTSFHVFNDEAVRAVINAQDEVLRLDLDEVLSVLSLSLSSTPAPQPPNPETRPKKCWTTTRRPQGCLRHDLILGDRREFERLRLRERDPNGREGERQRGRGEDWCMSGGIRYDSLHVVDFFNFSSSQEEYGITRSKYLETLLNMHPNVRKSGPMSEETGGGGGVWNPLK
eukprot:1381990-Amorphochlora_amoeboformis.AAC.2